MTEVLDFLRLLWARLGLPTCPECAATIENWSVDRITQAVSETYADQPIMVLAPVIRERKGEYRKELADFRTRGFVGARIDGVVRRLDEDIELHRYKYHTIELVLDRLKVEPEKSSRIAEAIEQALALANGLVAIVRGEGDDYRVFSTLRACPNGHGSIPEMEPRLFSFNSPVGACKTCDGLGTVQSFSEDLLVRDASLSLAEGALQPEGAMWTSVGKEDKAFPGVIQHLAQDIQTRQSTPRRPPSGADRVSRVRARPTRRRQQLSSWLRLVGRSRLCQDRPASSSRSIHDPNHPEAARHRSRYQPTC